MTLQKLLLGSAAFLALSFGVANAEGSGDAGERSQRIEKIFVELDVNQDGQITQAEIVTGAETRFTNADSDGDGRLSQAEFTADMGKHGQRAFSRLDGDGDGYITEAELDAALADGRTMHWLQKADANGDGAITREELETMKTGHTKDGTGTDGGTTGGDTTDGGSGTVQ